MFKKFTAVILSSILIFGVGFALAHAADTPPPNGSGGGADQSLKFKLDNPLKSGIDTVPEFLSALFDNVILPIGEVLIVLAFVFSGFKYVMAQGKPKEIEDANRALKYTAIGTAVLLGAWGLKTIIENTVNLLLK